MGCGAILWFQYRPQDWWLEQGHGQGLYVLLEKRRYIKRSQFIAPKASILDIPIYNPTLGYPPPLIFNPHHIKRFFALFTTTGKGINNFPFVPFIYRYWEYIRIKCPYIVGSNCSLVTRNNNYENFSYYLDHFCYSMVELSFSPNINSCRTSDLFRKRE